MHLNLTVGSRVHWTDPDLGLCSGAGTITNIYGFDDADDDEDTIIAVAMDNGGELEALPHELSLIDSSR